MRLHIIRIVLFGILLLPSISRGQQVPNFTLYKYNRNLINPANAATKDMSSLNLSFKSQMLGVSGAPETQVLSYTQKINRELGFGVSILNDAVFIQQNTAITADISYKLRAGRNDLLFFGLKIGTGLGSNIFTKAGAQVGDDNFDKNESFDRSQMGVGFFYQADEYFLSLSAPNLLSGTIFTDNHVGSSKSILKQVHIYAGGGYTYKIDMDYYLTSEIMVRYYDEAPIAFDLSSTLNMRNKIESGINYRFKESISIFSTFKYRRNYVVGFAYEMFTSAEIGGVFKNPSLELIFKYQWNINTRSKINGQGF
jgi:type IX secretion system PorP/SprF family membrane protein